MKAVTYSSKLFLIMLILGGFMSGLAWRVAINYEERVATAMLQADTKERSLLIRKQLETASSAIEDLASMYAVNNAISAEQFTRFVAPILARDPSLRALSWNPVVSHDNREAHESAMRESGLANYRITQHSPDGEIVTATPRDHYVVVAAIEPLEDNQSALGFDVGSEPTRRLALERARDSGELVVAAPILLVQSLETSRSALGFMPRYRSGSSTSTLAERRKNLEGFFVVVIDINNTVTAALSDVDSNGLELQIMTAAPGEEMAEAYVSAHFIDSANERGNSAADQKLWRSHTTSFTWAGQELALRYTATSAYRKAFQTWVPTGVLLAALALTVLVAAMLHLLRGQTARITQEVADRTRELQEANRDLEDHINRRIRVEQRLKAYRQDLEREVADRTSELNATTTKLRTILDSEPECVKIVSSDGRLEDMNPAGLAMIEAESLDQVRGSNVYSLIAEEYRDAFIDLNEQVIAGKSCTLQFKLNGLRGGVRWVDTSAVPLVDPDGGPTRHLAITRDITARKSEEEERARMELQLRHTQKLESIGVMAGGIAHDFNNLLQIIIGHGEIALHDESIRGHTRELLETSQSAAIDAASLCDQMLTYAGKSQPEKQTVELRRLVESMGNLLEVTRSENTEFEVLCDEVDDKIDGDVAQLRQVVMNLITNAAESIGDQPGRIAVTIRMTEVTADIAADNWVGAAPPTGQYVGFDVADSGCGLNEKTRERMFDPFFTTKFTGRGLGLASTLGIIKSHHGFIKVESRVGHGTCVTVLFPVSVKSEQKIAEPLHPPKPMSKTVLIVDDDEGVRRIGQMILERLGCRVESAADGENALRKLTNLKDSIDIVLLDVAMPGMNGNEVSARLRSIRPDIPIIFCSGYAADAVEPAPHSVGYTGFLRKPYRSDDLLEALRKAVRSQNPAKVAAVSAQ